MQTTKVIDHIVAWLKAYCDNAGLKGFVVGISGGIDSAVTSTLCAKTGKDVIVLTLPIFQSPEQLLCCEQHIAWLEEEHNQVKVITIDLTPPFQALENSFPPDIQDGLTMANTRARMRMLALYAFANHHKMLVVGTGNKVEDFGVGFFTKYGDGGVDISPIADLMKSEVYEVGRELGICEAILHAPPTDGLWMDNRTDESQIGATYDELEWAMQFEAEPQDEDQLGTRQREVLVIYRRFHQANKHKMDSIPTYIIPESLK
jgi:NAD+ synthase